MVVSNLTIRNGNVLKHYRHDACEPRSSGWCTTNRLVCQLALACGLAFIYSGGLHAAESDPATAFSLPFFKSAARGDQQGVVRLVNDSAEAGTVTIHAMDDAGMRFGPVEVSLAAREAKHLNSDDLERGNPGKGISGAFGSGQGDWRLEFASSLDIAAMAFVRAAGVLTSLHDIAPERGLRHYVPTFNPGRNASQVSFLRLINDGDSAVEVTIHGVDDAGDAAPGGVVSLTLDAGQARTLSATQLEEGDAGLSGGLGVGAGKWRLFVVANGNIQAMSVLEGTGGHLTSFATALSATGWRSWWPGGRVRDCEECPELAVVPAGAFWMGFTIDVPERPWNYSMPARWVEIPAPLAVGVFEVTYAEWDACLRGGGCDGYRPSPHTGPHSPDRATQPVTSVTKGEAQAYTEWLSQTTGKAYRLPSEAEWEYIARAGTETTHYWGSLTERHDDDGNIVYSSAIANTCLYENVRDESDQGGSSRFTKFWCNDGHPLVAPVGSYRPNPFGVHDMLGNVREWVQDCWNDNYDGVPTDGSAWMAGDCATPVFRGGFVQDVLRWT